MFSRRTKRIVLISIVVILLCLMIAPTFASGSSTYPERTVNVKMLYDDSYESLVSTYAYSDNVYSRTKQISEVAALPFKFVWNIELNIEVADFASTVGMEYPLEGFTYPNSCSGLWTWNSNGTDHVWDYDSGQCTCVSNSQCYTNIDTAGHHNSGSRYLRTMYTYLNSNGSDYDICGSIFGHGPCFNYNSGQHGAVGGLASRGYNTFLINASMAIDYSPNPGGQMPTEQYSLLNFLSGIRVFQHEISHTFNLNDGQCSTNQPCTMSGGFNDVVMVYDIWCDNCKAAFDFDKFDASEGE